jgi:hypothetical protein
MVVILGIILMLIGFGGGSGLSYPEFIPKDEIWVEKHESDMHDFVGILAHEIEEYMLIRNGKPYQKAHEIALQLEKRIRQQIPEV